MGLMVIFPKEEGADTEVRIRQLLDPVFTKYPDCTVIRTERELEALLAGGGLIGKKRHLEMTACMEVSFPGSG